MRILLRKEEKKIIQEIKLALHASRDCLRNKGKDTSVIGFDKSDVYYGEAFGILRSLKALGYGDFGPGNIRNERIRHWNLTEWIWHIEQEVLEEENFIRHGKGTNECDFCVSHFGKDGAGRKR